MEVEFTKSFLKDLKNIDDKYILNKVKLIILEIENSSSLSELQNVKFIVNSKYYFRIRIGDYRIGIKVEDNLIKLIRCLHRKEIYKRFP
ncbi:MAG: type II toxin-antitoxin system mRNA interferase toxin, RelE/StbE family [bacterium]